MTSGRGQLFGSDLQLRDGAGGVDLTLEGPVGWSGDLALVHGNDNIVQALTLRLRIRKGELAALGWPDYGSRLHELIGEPDLPRTRLKAQAFARQAIEADPRVQRVSALQVFALPGERAVLRLTMEVLLITQPTPLNLVFDFALEGT